MITIREFAEQNNISYEAARQQVKRYEKELGHHITYRGKTRLLDSEAVEFLNKVKESNPFIIMNTMKDDKIKSLEADNQKLLLKVQELESQLKKSELEKAVLSGKLKGHKTRKWWEH